MKFVWGAAASLLLGGCAVASGDLFAAQEPTYIDAAEANAARRAAGGAELVCEGVGHEPVRLRLEGASSQIRLPASMTALGDGGVDGWRPLEAAVVGERLATGSVKLNMLQRAHLTLDRTTGDLDLTATGLRYKAACKPAG